MAFWQNLNSLFAKARRKKEPVRDTDVYPRLMQLGNFFKQKTRLKPTPPNLRYFSRTVYARAAINHIKNPISQLEWHIIPMPGIKLNSELEKQIEIATNCFQHPNNDDSFATLIEQVIEDYCIFGAGVIEQQIGNDPIRPLWMWPVDAQSIQIYPDWDGTPTDYRYLQTLGYSNTGILPGKNLTNQEIVYIKCNPSTDTPYGYGPIEIAFSYINRLLGVENYAGNLASNANPQNIIFVGNWDDSKLKAFRHYWTNQIEGAGQTPLIGGDTKPEVLNLHSGDDSALYLEYQEFLIRAIATCFGLSPQKFGIEKDVNRSTAEVASDNDWDTGVKPVGITITRYLNREVLHRRLGFYQLQFQLKGLHIEDELNLAKIYEIEFKNNCITPNEYRLARGKEPMDNDWGDKVNADVEIAISAARGTKVVDDSDLPKIKTPTQSNSKKGNDNE